MARKKRTVTVPRVVAQASPHRRLLWLALSSAGVLLALWLSFDYGRSLHAGTEKSGDAMADWNPEQRISQLEQDRDQLRQRIARLERELQSGRQHVRDPEAIVRALAGKQKTEPAAVPAPAEAETPDSASNGPSGQLQLTKLEIEPTGSDNHFRYRFAVVHPGNEADEVVGTIWIAVNGLSNGRPVRLSLRQVSSEPHSYLDMRLTGRQAVDGELTLPPGFEPKNIAIEAKPYDKKYRGASGKFDWTADGYS